MSGAASWPLPADAESVTPLLLGESALLDAPLTFCANGITLVIRSNSLPLLERLTDYFGHLAQAPTQERLEIIAVERPVCDSGLPFIDWRREPGKQGRKDAYLDLTNGRLLLKVRTGMLFLQSATRLIAAGPCLTHDNQLINFINSQLMNRLQQRGWLICHAAALVRDGMALALAGFSGNGKSTLMLRLLESPEYRYLTNDRLFLRAGESGVMAVGIPKLPRINPGTLVNNPRLAALLTKERQQALRQLPSEELWALEEKHDVDVAALYGEDRIDTSTPRPLTSLLILNWSHATAGSTRLQRVDLERRRDLLPAVMKSPGPFYQDSAGRFQRDDEPLPEAAYLPLLREVAVFEVTGGIDFDRLAELWARQS
ncbi:MAG: HprK-related kinase B [Chromatiales bacterium]|jgi:HprK-related kinase B